MSKGQKYILNSTMLSFFFYFCYGPNCLKFQGEREVQEQRRILQL